MRTEIKIGVAAATFIAMVAVLYFFLLDPGRQDQQEESLDQAHTDQREADDERADALGGTRLSAQERERAKGSGSPSEHLIRADELPGQGSADSDSRTDERTRQEKDTWKTWKSVMGMPAGSDAAGGRAAASEGTSSPRGRSGPSAARTGSAAESGTYVVQEGDDTGFWGIAEKIYGKGSLYYLLAKANPDVDSRRLRVGQVIKVPPRPSPAESRSSTTALVLGAGDKKYVVQEGDAGFWTVAVRMYGRGLYWPVIQRANPGVDPRRLRAGQELVVPKLTEEMQKKYGSRTATASAARRETAAGGPPRPIFD